MKKSNLCFLALSLLTVSNVHARVGDSISNHCQVVSVIEKTEQVGAAQYARNINLTYQTLTTTLNCEHPMPVTGGLVITSPFKLTMSYKLKNELTRLANSAETLDVSFIDDAYTVKPERIGDISSFPDPHVEAYRVVGGGTNAFEKEAAYDELDQVLNGTGAVEISKIAVNYKDPNDTRPSWDKTFHFLAQAGDFELTIAQEGPHFFKAWQVPSVTVNAGYIMTAAELAQGTRTPHELSLQDSALLQKALGAKFYSTGDAQSKINITCAQDRCSVQILPRE
jgi:hypothetical protein